MTRYAYSALLFKLYVPMQGTPQCTHGDVLQCRDIGTPARQSLSWRSFPYAATEDLATYGGPYLEEVIQEWFEGPALNDEWDLLWTFRLQRKALKSIDLPGTSPRLVNHCGYFRGAGQKCLLARHIARVLMARQSEFTSGDRAVGFLHTYELHNDVSPWIRHVAEDPDRYWIIKKCAGGGSEGVKLVHGRDALSSAGTEWLGKWFVAQEYVERPFLGYGGRKFHLRLYIIVTSWWPSMSVLLYDEGILFRSRHKYVHGKPSLARDIFSYMDNGVEGQPLQALWNELDKSRKDRLALEGEGASVSAAVRARIVSTFKALFGHAIHDSFGDASELARTRVGCFDIFGADVMLDEQLRPALLEINMSPNLETDDHGPEYEALLKQMKQPLLRQVLHWAALRLSANTANISHLRSIEEVALRNFTRVL